MNSENVPNWLLTGFQRYENETESTNQRGEGSDSSAPTTRTPTRSRSTRAANSVSTERSVSQSAEDSNSSVDLTNARFSIGSSDNSSEGFIHKIKDAVILCKSKNDPRQ